MTDPNDKSSEEIFYITLSSADNVLENIPNSAAEFRNVLPRTVNFDVRGSKKLKVALASFTYKSTNQHIPLGTIAYLNTDAVDSNIIVGSLFTNSIHRVVLNYDSSQQGSNPDNVYEWRADYFQWYDASSAKFATIDIGIYDIQENAHAMLSGTTFVTLAFKVVDV